MNEEEVNGTEKVVDGTVEEVVDEMEEWWWMGRRTGEER